MKREFELAQTHGDILIDNSFETEKGKYQVVIRKYRSDIFFFKYRDGRLLECQDFSKVSAKGGAKDGGLV